MLGFPRVVVLDIVGAWVEIGLRCGVAYGNCGLVMSCLICALTEECCDDYLRSRC